MGIDLIDYLENEVLQSVITDIVNVAAYHARRHTKSSGHFSIPRQVFCYIDHLGYIAYGDSSSTNRSIKFIREFFPQNYNPFTELLHSMWRHGTVHQLKPYSYRAPLSDKEDNQVEVKWISTNHNRKKERANHLLVFPMENINNTVYLHVNICQLADDLFYAINKMIDALRNGTLDKHACTKRIDDLQKTHDYTYKKLSGWVVNAIKDQIREAWRQQDGMLSKNGNVIKKHPKSRHLT